MSDPENTPPKNDEKPQAANDSKPAVEKKTTAPPALEPTAAPVVVPPAAPAATTKPSISQEEKAARDAARKKVHDTAWKAFQTMWVAGTAGAFFTALTRSVPLHLREFSWSFQGVYTADRFLRYGYLLWLLAYFFTSNLNNSRQESPEKRDIPYDVLQSVLALAAVFLLGFIVPGAGFSFAHYAFAYIAANAAIALICLFALIFFYDVPPPGINAYRIAGLVISIVSIALAHLRMRPELAMSLFAILQLALWIVLVMYIRKRLHLAADTTYKAEKQKAAELKKSGEIKA